ncbi:hypothetical protein ABW19_dt0209701 [Dactylella cylindrospora]|nr:hypothetical protein ABW19_dt0209701 [Dactylella cylindrospora]
MAAPMDKDAFLKALNDDQNPWLNQSHPSFIDGYETREEAEFSGRIDVIDAMQASAFNDAWKQSRGDDRMARYTRNRKRLNDHLTLVRANIANDPDGGHLIDWNIELEKENRMTVTHARIRQTKGVVRGDIAKSQATLAAMSLIRDRNPGMPFTMAEEQRFKRELYEQLKGYTALSSTISAEETLLGSFEKQARGNLPPPDTPLYRFMNWRIELDVMHVKVWLDGIYDAKHQLAQNLIRIGQMMGLTSEAVPAVVANISLIDDRKLWIEKIRQLERLEKWKGPQHQQALLLREIGEAVERISEASKGMGDLERDIFNIIIPIYRRLEPPAPVVVAPVAIPQQAPIPMQSQTQTPISPIRKPTLQHASTMPTTGSSSTMPNIPPGMQIAEIRKVSSPPPQYSPEEFGSSANGTAVVTSEVEYILVQKEPEPQPKQEPVVTHTVVHTHTTTHDDGGAAVGACCGCGLATCCCQTCPCCLLCTVM